MRTKIGFFTVKIVCLAFILGALLVPLQTEFARGAEGITLEKDVFLQYPILGIEDLPDEITFALYASASATTPLATQAFSRGKYTVDFDINKTDGVALGAIARLKVDFTDKLNMGDDPESRPREIWSEVKVNGQVLGDRTRVTDEAMVKLLLASDASIATYLTLVYEGDDNPIATIYRELPLSSSSGTSANDYITSLFSAYSPPTNEVFGSLASPYWELSNPNIYYNDGYVGIGTVSPAANLHIQKGVNITNVADSNSVIQLESGANATNFWFNVPTALSGGTNATMGFATGGAIQHGMTYNVANDYLILTNDGANGSATSGIIIDNSGKIGVGTTSPSYLLAVKGSIGCQELTITNTGWSDFVFEKNYKLPPLKEVEEYISKNKHLPGIPTEAEVKEKGVSVGNISSKLLQKIEELTLYLIDLKKENDSLKAQLATIQKQFESRPN